MILLLAVSKWRKNVKIMQTCGHRFTLASLGVIWPWMGVAASIQRVLATYPFRVRRWGYHCPAVPCISFLNSCFSGKVTLLLGQREWERKVNITKSVAVPFVRSVEVQCRGGLDKMIRAPGLCPQLDFCQAVSLTRMFFPSRCECSILRHWMLSSQPAFEEEVVGLVPSLAASEVGREAGKWESAL